MISADRAGDDSCSLSILLDDRAHNAFCRSTIVRSHNADVIDTFIESGMGFVPLPTHAGDIIREINTSRQRRPFMKEIPGSDESSDYELDR
jgi:hypothetical protein